MADRKKCSTFGVWLQTDLDSAAKNLMETIIKVYICLKTRSREIALTDARIICNYFEGHYFLQRGFDKDEPEVAMYVECF